MSQPRDTGDAAVLNNEFFDFDAFASVPGEPNIMTFDEGNLDLSYNGTALASTQDTHLHIEQLPLEEHVHQDRITPINTSGGPQMLATTAWPGQNQPQSNSLVGEPTFLEVEKIDRTVQQLLQRRQVLLQQPLLPHPSQLTGLPETWPSLDIATTANQDFGLTHTNLNTALGNPIAENSPSISLIDNNSQIVLTSIDRTTSKSFYPRLHTQQANRTPTAGSLLPPSQLVSPNHPTAFRKSRAYPKQRERVARSIEKQQEAIQRHAKRIGAPTGALDVMCVNIEFQAGRQKSSVKASRTRNSCLCCIINRKKCSDERPCPRCREQWEKFENRSTSFRWTCNVRQSFDDLIVFNQLFDNSSLYERVQLLFKSPGIDLSSDNADVGMDHPGSIPYVAVISFLKQHEYLFELLDNLEPQTIRAFQRHMSGCHGGLNPYFPSMIHWMHVLIFLQPDIQDLIIVFDGLFQKICKFNFDKLYTNPLKADIPTLLVLSELLEQVTILKKANILKNESTIALRYYLINIMAMFWPSIMYKSNRDRNLEICVRGLATWFNSIDGLSSFIPPAWRSKQSEHEHEFSQYLYVQKLIEESPSSSYRNNAAIPSTSSASLSHQCNCTFIFQNLPGGLTEYLGFPLSSFKQTFHPINIKEVFQSLWIQSFPNEAGPYGNFQRVHEYINSRHPQMLLQGSMKIVMHELNFWQSPPNVMSTEHKLTPMKRARQALLCTIAGGLCFHFVNITEGKLLSEDSIATSLAIWTTFAFYPPEDEPELGSVMVEATTVEMVCIRIFIIGLVLEIPFRGRYPLMNGLIWSSKLPVWYLERISGDCGW